MRLRISLLVVATSSLVLVSFLVPLALVLRTLAADRAISAATAQAESMAQSMAPLVTTLETSSLQLTVDLVNAETDTPVTIFLPSGAELGLPAPVSPAVQLARNGRSFSAEAPGGEQVLVAVEGLAGGSAAPLRGQDALAPAGKVPALQNLTTRRTMNIPGLPSTRLFRQHS